MFRAVAAATCMLVCATTIGSAQSTGLDAAMQSLIATPQLRHALVAAEVYDLDSHRALYAYNAQTLMLAASTTKTVTEDAALSLLGPAFTWTTPVYRTGPIDAQGTLHGNLVLVASGDPNLSQRIQPDGTLAFENEDHSYDGSYDTKAVPGDPLAVLRDLAAQVAKAGVKHIVGGVFVDTSLFADAGAESGTGAVISPIVVNDNLVDVTVTPGSAAGAATSVAISPQTTYVSFVNKATTAAAGTEPTISLANDVTDQSGHHTVTITGKIPAGRSILYAYRVPEPKRFAQLALTLALRDAGVRVDDVASAATLPETASASYTPANLVAKHVSPPLAQDVYVTLKVSDNLHADLMPYMWAIYAGHAKTDLVKTGFAMERALLQRAGLDLHGASQQDGLGTQAFFTPDFMVHHLEYVSAQPWFPDFERALPVLGVDGTLFNIQNDSPARARVFAKTGSWGGGDRLNDAGIVTAKGLAGYMTTSQGHHVAFAFYINRMQGKQSVNTANDMTHQAGELLGQMATTTYESL